MTDLIVCRPCLAFDALAALTFKDYCRNDIPYLKQWVQNTFKDVLLNPSNSYFNLLISHYELDEIEKFSIEKLVSAYSDILRKGGYPNQVASEMQKGLNILRNSDFAEIWQRECLPILEQQCTDFITACDKDRINNILCDISRIKQSQNFDQIHISMNYFMYSMSFQLSTNSYLTNYSIGGQIKADEIMQLFAHELSHRFSNNESRSAYQNAYLNDEYLKKTNWYLSKVIGSPGDEEEFVTAIEHTLAVKNGLETYEQACKNIFERRNSCMPISAILFVELYKLKEFPLDMNQWICSKFEDETIQVGHIAETVNELFPGYADRFYNNWKEEKLKKPERFNEFEKAFKHQIK